MYSLVNQIKHNATAKQALLSLVTSINSTTVSVAAKLLDIPALELSSHLPATPLTNDLARQAWANAILERYCPISYRF